MTNITVVEMCSESKTEEGKKNKFSIIPSLSKQTLELRELMKDLQHMYQLDRNPISAKSLTNRVIYMVNR